MSFLTLFRARRKAHKALDKFLFVAENAKREQVSQAKILTKKEKVKKFFSKVFPPFRENFYPISRYDRIFSKGTKENALFQLFRNILLLEIFGVIMYFVLSFKYAKDPGQAGTFISAVIHFFLSIMFVFPTVMYYFIIAIHRMLSTKIRTLLLLIILSLAFEVPAMNAVNNIHNIAEGVACIQDDVGESVGKLEENVKERGREGLGKIRDLVDKMAVPMNKFKKFLKAFDAKMTRFIETIRQTWKSISNLTNECKQFMKGPFRTCKTIFNNAYIKCTVNERFFTTDICNTIHSASKVCEVGHEYLDSICNFPATVKMGLKDSAVPVYKTMWSNIYKGIKYALTYHIKGYNWVKGKLSIVKKEFKNTRNLGLLVENQNESNNELGALKNSLKKSLKAIINTYKTMIRIIVDVVHWTFIPLAFLWPFFSTAFFVYRFNYREEYKNTYLTKEIDNIDLNCALRGSTKILPLNKKEKEVYTVRTAWKMSLMEKQDFRLSFIMTFIAAATPFAFIMLDLAIYKILTGVYEFFQMARIDFPSHYEMKVSGEGFNAQIMRILLETFSPITEGIRERDERWRACFKEPNPPDHATYCVMLLLFLICLFLCRLKVWLNRQSLALADYFYPHRVRPRALMLYNRILQERKNLLGQMMQKQRAQLADDQMAGREAIVRRGMQSRGYIRVQCCKCLQGDLRLADEANSRLCVQCGSFYCINCFCLMRYCVECEHDMQTVGQLQLYYEEESDDEEKEEEEEEDELEKQEQPGVVKSTETNKTASTDDQKKTLAV